MMFLKRHKKKFVLLIFLIFSFHSMLPYIFNNFERESTSTRPPRAINSSQSMKLKTNEVLLKAAKPNKSRIDMVNDYYPFVDFRFVYPEISPKVDETRKIFMIILVNSGAKGIKFRQRREAIRQTWGSTGNCEQLNALGDGKLKDLRWLLVFVVGKAGPGTRDDELNEAEARRYNDMLIGNITDNYINNIIKFYMGHFWANKFDVKYTMKTDDDVYVRIPRVLEYLVNAKLPRPFYGGSSLAPSHRMRRYVASFKDCEIFSWNAFGHSLDPRSMKELHLRVQNLVCKNITLDIEDHRCGKSAVKTTTSTRGRFR
ncbi:beta-1,3-galactosyltransferase brn-like [Dendronephthya gigantea]|uniref:beta-1,3-galactosyltransferase brn-like n=1 Tax=Dendronephthya gigantea TaxID=151771 RepID=UPI00106B464A|nr:beta-1,3-galactosyltransferase brn-like [Dendronephthya gigantea]